jgi:hypothetical protein
VDCYEKFYEPSGRAHAATAPRAAALPVHAAPPIATVHGNKPTKVQKQKWVRQMRWVMQAGEADTSEEGRLALQVLFGNVRHVHVFRRMMCIPCGSNLATMLRNGSYAQPKRASRMQERMLAQQKADKFTDAFKRRHKHIARLPLNSALVATGLPGGIPTAALLEAHEAATAAPQAPSVAGGARRPVSAQDMWVSASTSSLLHVHAASAAAAQHALRCSRTMRSSCFSLDSLCMSYLLLTCRCARAESGVQHCASRAAQAGAGA